MKRIYSIPSAVSLIQRYFENRDVEVSETDYQTEVICPYLSSFVHSLLSSSLELSIFPFSDKIRIVFFKK